MGFQKLTKTKKEIAESIRKLAEWWH